MQADEQAQLSREIQYPDGRLIAKGTIGLKSSDQKTLSLGLSKAADLDSVYGGEDATLFLLAIGNEGPILAAAKYPLKDQHFPFVFEVLDDDLLPPYEKETWASGINGQAPVVVTAILSTSSSLAHPQGYEKIGVGVSTPAIFASKKIRSPAKILIADNLPLDKYTASEYKLFGSIDDVLNERAARKAETNRPKDGKKIQPTVQSVERKNSKL